MFSRIFVVCSVVCAFMVGQGPARGAVVFTPLGFLPQTPQTTPSSHATGLSANGSVVVGFSSSTSGTQAFRWTGGVMTGLGDFPSGWSGSEAKGVSADGNMVVGFGTGKNAFRWNTGDSVIANLGVGTPSTAQGVSDSVTYGTFIVGNRGYSNNQEGFLWTSGTPDTTIALPDLPNGITLSDALAVSADGKVAVGLGSSGLGQRVVRWEITGNSVTTVDMGAGSWAKGVSADGSVIVGQANFAAQGASPYLSAFRWTEDGGMVDLGNLTGGAAGSYANGVSGDGSIVVGAGNSGDDSTEAFIWHQDYGMMNLRTLVQNHVNNLTGWTLREATAISSDGTTIAGWGINPSNQTEAWVLNIGDLADIAVPEPSTLAIWSILGGLGVSIAWRRNRKA